MTLTINRYRKLVNQPLINEKRIYRIMRTHDLQAVIRRKRKGYRKTKADHVAENRLNREFKADKPNEKWCTDVTEFKYGVGKKAYLSAIIDLYDGSIVSYPFRDCHLGLIRSYIAIVAISTHQKSLNE